MLNRAKLGKGIAKFANLAALLSLFVNMFAFAPLTARAAALEALTTTLAQPIYSADFLTDQTYTNVTYSWEQTTAFEVVGGDPCIAANDCVDIVLDLQDTGTTTTYQGQEWQNTIVTGDITWNGPANSSVDTVTRTDEDGNGRFERLTLQIACSAACLFATSTAYTFDIVNYPIENPEEPVGYTEGQYTSLTHLFTADDLSASNQANQSKTSVVAIGKGITVTASVDPSLTFTVTGFATSTAFYSNTSTNGTVAHPDACAFGTLTPATPKICLFSLEIDTNATNGYSIYVVQDQDMTFGGNTIKQFANGTRYDDTAAVYWYSPSSTAYAHLGYSSDDTSVFAATSTALWAGIPEIADPTETAFANGTGLVADSASPGNDTYTYALKVESAASLPQGSNYTHNEYFLVVGNF